MSVGSQILNVIAYRRTAVVLLVVAMLTGGPPCIGQTVKTAEEIAGALTRSSNPIAPAKQTADEDGPRGISVAPRPVAEAPAQSISLDIPFELNSDGLRSGAAAQLDQLAQALRSDALVVARLEIAGHTDSTGSAAYNQALSLHRANSVRDYLVNKGGIAPGRLVTVGKGEDEPIPGTNPSSSANRRVEITVLDR